MRRGKAIGNPLLEIMMPQYVGASLMISVNGLMQQENQPHKEVTLTPCICAQATTKEGLDAVKAQLKGYSKGMEVSMVLHCLMNSPHACSP